MRCICERGMALCAPRASARATSLAPDEGGAVNLPMPHPDKPGTSRVPRKSSIARAERRRRSCLCFAFV